MPHRTGPRVGLRGFNRVLKEYRSLSTWAVGSAAAPFAASLASLQPPWPKGVVVLTGLLQIVALILVYHFVGRLARKHVDKLIAGSAVVLLCFSVLYLACALRFTYEAGPKHELSAKGYVCTQLAMTMYPDDCPDFSNQALSKVEYEATALWTKESVRNVQLMLFMIWATIFAALSTLIGSFIVFQARPAT